MLVETTQMFNIQVCSCGDQYNCVAYESESVRKDRKENESVWGEEEEENESGGEEEKENKRWVRRFGSQNEVKA